jgi:hypothetical protein
VQRPGTQRHRKDEQCRDGNRAAAASGGRWHLRRSGRRTTPGALGGLVRRKILTVYLIRPFSR